MAVVAGERDEGVAAEPSGEPGPRPGSARRWFRGLRRITFVVVGVLVLYVGVTFVQVWHASRQDEARPADAIIVLGAAQYDGRPSPVLAARLDHAANLYHQGLAPLIVVTGGRQEGDRYTEAGAAAAYLEQEHGVPGNVIERETSSRSSWESLAAAARFLREDGITDVLLVSDPYHSFRIDAIADDLGLTAHVSPTPSSPIAGMDEFGRLVRETAAVSVGRVIGYDRLVRLDQEIG